MYTCTKSKSEISPCCTCRRNLPSLQYMICKSWNTKFFPDLAWFYSWILQIINSTCFSIFFSPNLHCIVIGWSAWCILSFLCAKAHNFCFPAQGVRPTHGLWMYTDLNRLRHDECHVIMVFIMVLIMFHVFVLRKHCISYHWIKQS